MLEMVAPRSRVSVCLLCASACCQHTTSCRLLAHAERGRHANRTVRGIPGEHWWRVQELTDGARVVEGIRQLSLELLQLLLGLVVGREREQMRLQRLDSLVQALKFAAAG